MEENKAIIQIVPVGSTYGAPMGRADVIENVSADQTELYTYMAEMPLVDGDYDIGGAYWGAVSGTRMWVAECGPWFDETIEDDVYFRVYVRAINRQEAETQVRESVGCAGLVFLYAETNTYFELANEEGGEIYGRDDGEWGWRLKHEDIGAASGFESTEEAYYHLHEYLVESWRLPREDDDGC